MARCNILNAAVELALSVGFNNVRRDAVAQRAGCAAGMVNYVYQDMDGLRTAIMTNAIEHEYLSIVLQGLAQDDPIALTAPVKLKIKALATKM